MTETDESTARRLLLRLDREWDWPPPSLLEEIIACGEAAVAPLDELLSPELLAAAETDDKASGLVYYALASLGGLGTPAAIPPLVRAFPEVDEDTLEWMSDWIVPLGPDAIAPLLLLVADDGLGYYPRAIASNIAVELAGEDPERRAHVAGVLRPIVADHLARAGELDDDQQEVSTAFSLDLTHLADAEARPMIEAALADGRISDDFFNQEDVDEAYAAGGRPRHFTPKPWLDRYREDYRRHQAGEMFDAWKEEPVPEPVVLGRRLGRNEPCWCGSGKKYKKCHLAADEKEGRT